MTDSAVDPIRQLAHLYKEAANKPQSSMLYSPCPGYTLSYPGNQSSQPVHALLGGATRAERGWAARMRVQKKRGAFDDADDEYQVLNDLVHSKNVNSELDAAYQAKIEAYPDRPTWGGATDGFRGKAAEARESRFLTPGDYEYLSNAVKEPFMTGPTYYPMTTAEWKTVHKRPRNKDWHTALPKYP